MTEIIKALQLCFNRGKLHRATDNAYYSRTQTHKSA